MTLIPLQRRTERAQVADVACVHRDRADDEVTTDVLLARKLEIPRFIRKNKLPHDYRSSVIDSLWWPQTVLVAHGSSFRYPSAGLKYRA
jgi:hypothetical protein